MSRTADKMGVAVDGSQTKVLTCLAKRACHPWALPQRGCLQFCMDNQTFQSLLGGANMQQKLLSLGCVVVSDSYKHAVGYVQCLSQNKMA